MSFVYEFPEVPVAISCKFPHHEDVAKSDEVRRAGLAVAARRGELGLTQQELADDAAIDIKTVYNLESGARWPIAKNRAALAVALRWEPDALTVIASGATPAEASTGSASVPPAPLPAPRDDEEIPGVLNMLAVPGIGDYLAVVNAERDAELGGERPAALNQNELRIFADARFTETAKRALVAYRRMVLEQDAQSQGENAGLRRTYCAKM